jgi:type II restriction/modification system DNA methylase subunit YeeA
MSQKQNKAMNQHFYRASAADFMKIPGSPVAYWEKIEIIRCFELNSLSEFAEPKQGISTCNDSLFIRFWFEVSRNSMSTPEIFSQAKKWFPFCKGGPYRKWYGNNEYVLDWEDSGERVHSYNKLPLSYKGAPMRGKDYFFKEGMSWSAISSGKFSGRHTPKGYTFAGKGPLLFAKENNDLPIIIGILNSAYSKRFFQILSPTLDFTQGAVGNFPFKNKKDKYWVDLVESAIQITKEDWDSYETSWDFIRHPLIGKEKDALYRLYPELKAKWQEKISYIEKIEKENDDRFAELYAIEGEERPVISLEDITLTCNPHYRYGSEKGQNELDAMLQCDTLRELMSYAIGCMMGRYALDQPGLILASQGETLQDYLRQIPVPSFAPDDDAILPLTDQEWFTDDATSRFREFVSVVWGDENLQQNLDFVSESLCLHAIRPPSTKSGGESALDTIRRYLSTQFFKDHLRTYKKRPIYWLFSSGRHKAFECLVYLHRYNEGTLSRMRTEYVIPLSAKLSSYAEKLEQDRNASDSAAEIKRLEKELVTLHKQQAELAEFDEKLRHYADLRISLDLDDGVKLNYSKFGDLLAEVKAVTGTKE